MTAPGPADFVALALAVGAAVLWGWALVDTIRRQRYGWTAVVLLLPSLGAILYVVWGRQQRPGESPS
jgi:hypothetical protein